MGTTAKALILTSKTGGGHISLAHSLADRLAPRFVSTIVDPQPALIHAHYRWVSRYALWMWAAEYNLADTPTRALLAHKAFTFFLKRRLVQVIAEMDPDVIVGVYAFFSYSIQRALAALGRRTPFVLLFSDPLNLHSAWLTVKDADLTLAPSRESYALAMEHGFDPNRTLLTGWPVRSQFFDLDPVAVGRVAAELNLKPGLLTVFLQGGGEGTARFARTVDNLLALRDERGQAFLQLVLAVGTNKALQRRYGGVEHCRVVPFTPQIAPYMAAADIVMGKAGPNVLFESVTLGKPFLATTFLPGQEEGNLELIRRYGLGWVALRGEEQAQLLKRLATHPDELDIMRRSVADYAAWNRAGNERIRPAIEALVHETLP